jgi:hypothetical protein
MPTPTPTPMPSSWWYYDDTPLFESVAWDLGLIALRADRRRMAVLAATDTD